MSKESKKGVYFEGTGSTADIARQHMHEHAKEDGYKTPLQVTYQVRLTLDKQLYEGDHSKDFEKAYASATQSAGISRDEVPSDGIEVLARGMYQHGKAKAAGSCMKQYKTSDITNLF